MYKKIVKFSIGLTLLFSVACSDDFLQVENKNQLTDENFYQTQQDFWMALNSLYTPLAHAGMYGLQWQFVFGSFEDRLLFESTGMDMLTIDAASGNVQTIYGDLYKGVYRVNVFIDKLNSRQNVEGMSDTMRNQYMAQARALRAKYFFYLVTLFDKPPYYDDQSIPVDFNMTPENGTPEQFWDKIKEDLLFAQDNLPAGWPSADVGRITSGAARSLLGKAMLYKHYYYYVRNGQKGSAGDIADLQSARDAFLHVINSGTYELIMPRAPKTRRDYIFALLSNSSYVDLPAGNNIYVSENNKESVWEVQYSDERIQNGWLPGWQWSGALNFQYFSAHTDSYRNHEGHPDLWLAFETEGAPAGFTRDPRAFATFWLDNDTMDHRTGTPYFNTRYRSGIHNKRIARARGLIPTSQNPFPTTGFGVKKYSYPIYTDQNSPRNDPFNRRIIRFADVLLMYAEVTLLLNENTAAGLQALNRVRARVDMPPRAALTREIIIHERDVELAFEFVRWHDLIRWSFDPAWGTDMQQKLSRQIGPSGTGSFFVKGKHEFLPIPIREINLSEGKLIQNPGW